MISQSVTVRVLKALWTGFKNSAVFGLFIAFGEFFAGLYKNSLLKRYIDTKPFLNSSWNASFLAGISDAIAVFLEKIVDFFGRLLKRVTSGSMLGYAYQKTAEKIKYHHVLGIVFAAVFLIYSDWWNNMYAAGAAVILLFALIYKNRKTRLLPSNIDFFMVLFLLSVCLGVFAARDKADAIRIAIIAVTALIFHLCTTMALNTDKKIFDFTKIMAVTIAITAVVAICQRIVGIEVNPEFVDVANNTGMPGRVFSTMENPNNYAELLVLFMPFMLALVVTDKKPLGKVLWTVVLGITFVALMMTYSRSCYVAMAIALVVFILMYDYKLILPVIIVGAMLIPFLPETIFNRILTIGSLSDSSNSYRLYIWEVCARLIGNFGVSGLGIGPVAFADFYRPLAYTIAHKAPHSHMLYMELVLEYGIVGFIGFMGYYIRLIRRGFSYVKTVSKKRRAYLAAGVSALVGISFVCMAEYIWFYPRDMFAHFIVMGILAALVRNISKERNGAGK